MSSEDKIDVYTSSEDKIQAESSDYTLPQEHTAKKTFFSSFIESFQRADENEFDEHNNGKSVKPTFSQLETSVSNQLVGNITNKNTLKRNIKPRHQFMISIGTGVGTGMLVSTGSALRQHLLCFGFLMCFTIRISHFFFAYQILDHQGQC